MQTHTNLDKAETLKKVETLLKDLLNEYLPEEILRIVETYMAEIDRLKGTVPKPKLNLKFKKMPNLHKSVIDEVVKLIDNKSNRKITNGEILHYFTETGIFVDQWKDKDARLGAILAIENNKDNGRIRRVKGKRGEWEKKPEKVIFSHGGLVNLKTE